MILARAARELRALVDELRDDAVVAKRLGVELGGLIEAADGRTERLFWTVSDPHQYPGPSTHGALAGAWFHGALCAAVARGWEAVLPERLIGAGDLMEAIQSFEAESSETGDSRKTLSRYGMVRATLQPEFGALAPERAVVVVSSETGAPAEESRDLLGLFAIDGAVVARNALDRVTRDSGPPPAHIRSGLTSYRLHRNALEIMDMIATMPYDPDDL
ncbi:MAG: hypothetical protein LC777_06090 [Actinobacteria bacterium]|nr:hypothetical protein [Actinomycetota bacterium]